MSTKRINTLIVVGGCCIILGAVALPRLGAPVSNADAINGPIYQSPEGAGVGGGEYQDSAESPEFVDTGGELFIPPFGVEEMLFGVLSGATRSVEGWAYQITYSPMIQLLENVAFLRIPVQLIVEGATFGENSSTFDKLVASTRDSRVQIQSDAHLPVGYTHAKTFMVDDYTILGTANFGYQGIWRNREHRVLVTDPLITNELRQLFQIDRLGTTQVERIAHPNLLFCPINCEERLMKYVSSAQESIKMSAQYLSHPPLISLLEEKQQAGLQVELILGEYQDRERVEGLENVRILDEPYNHTKTIIVDEAAILTGSMNFSTQGITGNREVSIILQGPDAEDALGVALRQFETDLELADPV